MFHKSRRFEIRHLPSLEPNDVFKPSLQNIIACKKLNKITVI